MMNKVITFLFRRPFQFFLSLPYIRYSLVGALYQNSLGPTEKMLYTAMKYASVSKMRGDYFEFGVYDGGSFAAAYHISKRYLPDLHLYAFDSFQGLPGPDDTSGEFQPFGKGQFSCSQEQFLKNLRKKGVDLSRVHTVPGWYADTLNDRTRVSLPATRAAIIYIDCDLYESAMSVLNFVIPYIEDGTLIIFDDWFTYRGDPDRGEQRAFREWLGKNQNVRVSEYQKFGWSGNSFIIHKNKVYIGL